MRLPPPPPPPPGPGSASQMIDVFGVSGRTALAAYGFTGRLATQMRRPRNATSNAADATNEAVRRRGSWSNEKSISSGWLLSTRTDRCPADVLVRISPLGDNSVIWSGFDP